MKTQLAFRILLAAVCIFHCAYAPDSPHATDGQSEGSARGQKGRRHVPKDEVQKIIENPKNTKEMRRLNEDLRDKEVVEKVLKEEKKKFEKGEIDTSKTVIAYIQEKIAKERDDELEREATRENPKPGYSNTLEKLMQLLTHKPYSDELRYLEFLKEKKKEKDSGKDGAGKMWKKVRASNLGKQFSQQSSNASVHSNGSKQLSPRMANKIQGANLGGSSSRKNMELNLMDIGGGGISPKKGTSPRRSRPNTPSNARNNPLFEADDLIDLSTPTEKGRMGLDAANHAARKGKSRSPSPAGRGGEDGKKAKDHHEGNLDGIDVIRAEEANLKPIKTKVSLTNEKHEGGGESSGKQSPGKRGGNAKIGHESPKSLRSHRSGGSSTPKGTPRKIEGNSPRGGNSPISGGSPKRGRSPRPTSSGSNRTRGQKGEGKEEEADPLLVEVGKSQVNDRQKIEGGQGSEWLDPVLLNRSPDNDDLMQRTRTLMTEMFERESSEGHRKPFGEEIAESPAGDTHPTTMGDDALGSASEFSETNENVENPIGSQQIIEGGEEGPPMHNNMDAQNIVETAAGKSGGVKKTHPIVKPAQRLILSDRKHNDYKIDEIQSNLNPNSQAAEDIPTMEGGSTSNLSSSNNPNNLDGMSSKSDEPPKVPSSPMTAEIGAGPSLHPPPIEPAIGTQEANPFVNPIAQNDGTQSANAASFHSHRPSQINIGFSTQPYPPIGSLTGTDFDANIQSPKSQDGTPIEAMPSNIANEFVEGGGEAAESGNHQGMAEPSHSGKFKGSGHSVRIDASGKETHAAGDEENDVKSQTSVGSMSSDHGQQESPSGKKMDSVWTDIVANKVAFRSESKEIWPESKMLNTKASGGPSGNQEEASKVGSQNSNLSPTGSGSGGENIEKLQKNGSDGAEHGQTTNMHGSGTILKEAGESSRGGEANSSGTMGEVGERPVESQQEHQQNVEKVPSLGNEHIAEPKSGAE